MTQDREDDVTFYNTPLEYAHSFHLIRIFKSHNKHSDFLQNHIEQNHIPK